MATGRRANPRTPAKRMARARKPMPALRIGWAARDITPVRPAMLQGQMHCRVGHSAMDPVTVTAMAVESPASGECLVLVSCDLAFITDSLLRQVREQVAGQAPDLVPEKVLLLATHTHTSFVLDDGYYRHPGGDVMTAAEGTAWVAERAAAVAVAAWQTRTPRWVGRAFGHAVVGHNRYAVYANGEARMYGRTRVDEFSHIGGYEDHGLDMLFTWEPDGRLAGVALAIPCPSQVDEGLDVFSADYWHEIRVELRRRYGEHLQVLPLCSAAGDQSPHFLLYGREEEEMRRRRGLSERQEIAARVGAAVAEALACTPPPKAQDEVAFAHAVRHLSLPPYPVSKRDRDWAFDALVDCALRGDLETWWPSRLRAIVAAYDGAVPPPPVAVETHVIRLGDAAIVTCPFELFLDYSLRTKARSPAAQTLVIQLAGGFGWYLPTARALQGGGYGAMPAVCAVGPEGGARFVEDSLAAIAALFP